MIKQKLHIWLCKWFIVTVMDYLDLLKLVFHTAEGWMAANGFFRREGNEASYLNRAQTPAAGRTHRGPISSINRVRLRVKEWTLTFIYSTTNEQTVNKSNILKLTSLASFDQFIGCLNKFANGWWNCWFLAWLKTNFKLDIEGYDSISMLKRELQHGCSIIRLYHDSKIIRSQLVNKIIVG